MKSSRKMCFRICGSGLLRYFFLFLCSSVFVKCSKNSSTDNNDNNTPQQTQQFYDVQPLGTRPGPCGNIAVQPDGKIIVQRSNVAGDSIVRLLNSGELDPQFTAFRLSNNDYISEMLVQTDGKILVLGKLSLTGNPSLIRLSATGQFEKNLITTIGNNVINCMLLQPDGKILVGGSFSSAQGYNKLLRISSEGVLDNTFSSPFTSQDGAVMFLSMDSQGRIVAGGKLPVSGDAMSFRDVVRLKGDGSVDQTFSFKEHVAVPEAGTTFPTIVRTLAIDKQDRIFIGGDFLEVQSPDGTRTRCNNIVRIQSNGNLDKDFAYSDKGPGRVTSILPLSNGDVAVGRYWTYILLGNPSESVNFYRGKGEYREFQLGFTSGYVSDIIQESPQRILVSGGFTKSSIPQLGLCRLTAK